MVSNRVCFHIMALLVVLALMPRGILSAGEALSGFGNSAVVMFASLLVVGEMLDRTGVARAVGDLILKRGGVSETKQLLAIMAGAGLPGCLRVHRSPLALSFDAIKALCGTCKRSAILRTRCSSYKCRFSFA